MRCWNYTSLKTRDTKIYGVGGYNIAGGLSVEFLKVVAPITIGFMILGAIIGIPFNISFLNPFTQTKNFIWQYTVAWTGAGIGIGMGLWYIQFAGYRLYQYLGAYFKPKRCYTNAFKLTTVKLNDIKINAFIKHLL